MTYDSQELARELLDHLEATEELPLSSRTHQWLGEAQAAAEDAVGEDVSESVVRKRAAQVRELLANVDPMDNKEADRHVDEAKKIATAICE